MNSNPLQNVPAKVRTACYWIGYVLGVLGQGTTIVWGAVAAASPDVSMPLWLVIASAVLGLLQTQLNLLAGSNVPSAQELLDGEVTPAEVRGDAGTLGSLFALGLALLLIGAVLLVLNVAAGVGWALLVIGVVVIVASLLTGGRTRDPL